MTIGGIAELLKNLRRSRSGAAAVEFALLMIFIIMPLFYGLFEMSRALQQHHIVLKSVRDAARYAARLPRPEFTPPFTAFEDPCVAGSANEALDIKNLAMYGTLTTSGPPQLPGWTDYSTLCISGPTVTADFVSQAGTTMSGRAFVRVNAIVPYQDLGLFTLLGITDFNITAQHEEPYIGE